MKAPTPKTVNQFAKYLVGGSLYFWIGYGIFAICYSGLGWKWFPAKLLADAVGLSFNYFAQRYWTFGKDHSLKELQHTGRYVFIETIGFFLDYAIIWGLTAVGISPYLGFMISGSFFTVWSWLWYKHWVFI